MYLRTTKTQTYEYLRLVEAYREDGKNKQRVILNLGRKDLLAPHVGRLVEILAGVWEPFGPRRNLPRQ